MQDNEPCMTRVLVAFIALAVSAAGCGGSNGSAFSTMPAPGQSWARAANIGPQLQRKLYISNVNGNVLVYTAGPSPKLVQTITDGVPRPFGVWIDDTGVLYVVNLPNDSNQESLPEYEPGAPSPFLLITKGVLNFGSVAVDGKQNVFVSGLQQSNGPSFLELYPKGSLNPSETLTIPSIGTISRAESLTFDPSGNLLVGVAALPKKDNAVFRLAPGSQTFANLGLKGAPGGLIAADQAGNLYIGGGTPTIAVYSPNQTNPTRLIRLPAGHLVTALTVDRDGSLYVGSQFLVYEYAPGARRPNTTLTSAASIGGLALSPH